VTWLVGPNSAAKDEIVVVGHTVIVAEDCYFEGGHPQPLGAALSGLLRLSSICAVVSMYLS